jgi:hypothetical protein
MTKTQSLRRTVLGTLLSVGVAVVGLGLAAGTAQAQPRVQRHVPLLHVAPRRTVAEFQWADWLEYERLPRLVLRRWAQ